MVSAGNTGAAMAAALLRMGRVKGVNRPAIATPIPVPGHRPNILLDAGANAEVQPEWLVPLRHSGGHHPPHPSVGVPPPAWPLYTPEAAHAAIGGLTRCADGEAALVDLPVAVVVDAVADLGIGDARVAHGLEDRVDPADGGPNLVVEHGAGAAARLGPAAARPPGRRDALSQDMRGE